MPLSATLIWEIRTTGNSLNGGAFRAGATGTDYSQQDAAQVSYTDLAVDASNNLKVSSAANPFTAAHVGNVINIASTSPWTAGYYEVMSVASGAATLDRSPAATGTAGGVGKLGGASDSPNTICGAVVPSNVVWIKQGTYASVNAYFTANMNPASATSPTSLLSGYGAVRGDGGMPSLVGVGSGTVIRTNNGWTISNLSIGGGVNIAMGIQAGFAEVINCKVFGGASNGISTSANSLIAYCEVLGGGATSGVSIGINATSSNISNCYVHDRNGVGIQGANAANVIFNVVANCGGDGIKIGGSSTAYNNTVYNSGGNGINRTDDVGKSYPILGNLLALNAGYGVVFGPSPGVRASLQIDGNAYYANTSGTRLNGADTTVNPQNASGAYTNVRDKILTANPFVNAATADYRLNNTAGGGALCRGVGIPSAWPGLTVAGSADFGAIEHQDAAGGGGCVIGSPIIQASRRVN